MLEGSQSKLMCRFEVTRRFVIIIKTENIYENDYLEGVINLNPKDMFTNWSQAITRKNCEWQSTRYN